MKYRPLGSTGIDVSELSFGCGPVPALLTEADEERHRAVVAVAIRAGINWFDTAATYGNGQSERSLGAALRALGASSDVHVATKVRLLPDQLGDVRRHVRASVEASLDRLGLEHVALVQIHNSITRNRGDEPTSLTPADVLGPGGMLEALEELRGEGRMSHLGLTGIGQPEALLQAIHSDAFDTMQTPYHLLNPSAGREMDADFEETNYGNIIAACASQKMGVFAIRVYAGGALAGLPPSEHTHRTKFFPLDLYQRDLARREELEGLLDKRVASLKEAAVRYVLAHQGISSAIIGFGAADHVQEALAYQAAGPLPVDLLETIDRWIGASSGSALEMHSDEERAGKESR